MLKKIVLFLILFLPYQVFADQSGIDVKYCSELFEESGKWKYSDKQALDKNFTVEAEKIAVNKIFNNELTSFDFTVLTKEKIVNALRTLLKYDGFEIKSSDPMSFCMVLQKCSILKEEASKFKPVEVARICNTNPEFIKTLVAEIKKSFVSSIKGNKSDAGQIDSVLSMMLVPETIKTISDKELAEYLHEKNIAAPPGPVTDMKCVSLIVYPVELYTASSKK